MELQGRLIRLLIRALPKSSDRGSKAQLHCSFLRSATAALSRILRRVDGKIDALEEISEYFQGREISEAGLSLGGIQLDFPRYLRHDKSQCHGNYDRRRTTRNYHQ